jgi:hypothetical protein
MIKITNVNEAVQLMGNLSGDVVNVVTDIVSVLDNLYGVDRDIEKSLGGYVLILESKKELKRLLDIFIDVETVIPEYTDKIPVKNGEPYTNT